MPTIVRQPLLRELEPFETRVRRLFAGMPLMPTAFGTSAPAADVYETPDEYVVELEVPGYQETELKVEVSDHTVTVTGTREESTDENHKRYQLHERLEETFERAFILPPETDGSQVKASFADGVLKLSTPRHEIAKARTVSIEKP